MTHVKPRADRSGSTSLGSGEGSGFVTTPTILVTGGHRIPLTGHRFGGLRVPAAPAGCRTMAYEYARLTIESVVAQYLVNGEWARRGDGTARGALLAERSC